MRWLPGLAKEAYRSRYGLDAVGSYLIDLRFGGRCGGVIPSPYAERGAYYTVSVYYHWLDYLFSRNNLVVSPGDVLVDVGCGKGRVINWWLRRGYQNQIVGIELNERVAEATRVRLRGWPNVEIITGDAVDKLPGSATLMFMFCPFKAPVMERFSQRLRELAKSNRGIRVVYYNCKYLDVFQSDKVWDVRALKTGNALLPAALIQPRRPELCG